MTERWSYESSHPEREDRSSAIASADPTRGISVLIPTYYRPDSLTRCLAALASQSRPADQVVIVHRNGDDATASVLAEWSLRLPIDEVSIAEHGGVVAAMNAGLARCRGDVVAITDDDAAPRTEWLEMLEAYFADVSIGGVGGRDNIWQLGKPTPPTRAVVGKVQWFGRVIGNHHLGMGAERDVDVLKGVNCAYRREALEPIGFDSRLRGPGAQMYWELSLGLAVRRNGWRLVYDPTVLVDHFPARRADADRVGYETTSEHDITDAAYNQTLLLLEHLAPLQRLVYLLWVSLIGTNDSPGIVHAARLILAYGAGGLRQWQAANRGRADAYHRRSNRRSTERRSPVPSRPRVTLVAHDIHDGGGMERAHAELVRQLHRDFDLTVVSATLAEDLRPLVRWRQVKVPHRPFVLKFLAFFVRAGLEVRRADSELFHTLGAIIPNRTDVASVHFCHAGHRAANGGLAPVGAPPMQRLNATVARLAALLAERWSYRPGRVDTLAVVSDELGREVAAHYPGVDVAVTPNGVDAARFHPQPERRQAARAELGIGSEQYVALFVGGDWYHKGLGLAVEAVAKARAEVPDLVLLVVGLGDRARFAASANRVGVKDSVRFFGRRADPERFYQAADVFVLPSAYETFSIACFEAAACGLPLVIPPLSGAGALVGADEAGIIVDRDAASIAAALVRLAVDPRRRADLGAEAHRRAASYTWEASVAAVRDIYRARLRSVGP